jgi:spore coat polysaccharide biosynthesis protein SpsF (cytidylyltransferase family)
MDEKKENLFGKTVILKEQVVCVDEDEDLKLFKECCEHVCKIFVKIQNKKEMQAEEVEPSRP